MKVFLTTLMLTIFSFAYLCSEESMQDYYQAGLSFSRMEKWPEAIEALSKAYQIAPNNEKICLALGLTFQRSGDVEQSLVYLKKTLAIDPRSVGALYSLALIYEKKKDYPSAINCWDEFLSLSDNEKLKNVARKHLKYLREIVK